MKLIRTLLLLVAGVALASCTKDGDTIYIDDDASTDSRPIVYFLSKKGSMGDLSYVDAVYRGVVRAAKQGNMLLSQVQLPTDTATMAFSLQYMLDYMKENAKERKALVVIANDNLEALLHQFDEQIAASPNVQFLLSESSDTTLSVHTVKIRQYGAYYQAGRLVSLAMPDVKCALICSANPNEVSIHDMSTGFKQAINDTKAANPTLTLQYKELFMTTTNGGYDMADVAYKMGYFLGDTTVVLPLCGGTAQGFYRYNRENPNSFYTIGVDMDMQQYSSRVPFSVVKHIDQVVQDCVTKWANGETLPKHLEYGLESGYTELIYPNRYYFDLAPVGREYYQESIEKEKAYYEQK